MFLSLIAGVYGGAVYLFDFDNATEVFHYFQKLTPTIPTESDQFGHSVAINGKYVVVGAPQNDSVNVSNVGAAYIFEMGAGSDKSFSLISDLRSPSPAVSALFGWSVAVNSNGVIAIGAKGDRVARGSVYIFKPTESGQWEHAFTIEPNATQSFLNLGNAGWSVAINDE